MTRASTSGMWLHGSCPAPHEPACRAHDNQLSSHILLGARQHQSASYMWPHLDMPAYRLIMLPSFCFPGLSAREQNQRKRKAKALLKQDSGMALSAAPCSSKKVKLENGGAAAAGGSDAEALPTTADRDAQLWQNICAGQWPFQQLYEELTEQVLSPLWEVSSQLQSS